MDLPQSIQYYLDQVPRPATSKCVQRERRPWKPKTWGVSGSSSIPLCGLLRFLELSRVGGLVGDEDVEETRAARLDGWIAWEAGIMYLFVFFSLTLSLSVRFSFEEGHIPRTLRTAHAGSKDFLTVML